MTFDPDTPLGWACLALRPSRSGGFMLGPAHSDEIARRIEALPDRADLIRDSVEDLIGLAITLRHRHGSEEAADVVARGLAMSPRAVAVLGLGDEDNDHAATALYLGERNVLVRAPSVGARAPEGSVKLSAFLEPGRTPLGRPSSRTAAQPQAAPESGDRRNSGG